MLRLGWQQDHNKILYVHHDKAAINSVSDTRSAPVIMCGPPGSPTLGSFNHFICSVVLETRQMRHTQAGGA